MKNIVLFMVDQLSAKWLEAAIEHDICPLDNFKELISTGTYFSNAITSNPVCCPARSTIATGLTTRGHGVLENGYALDPKIPTFMKVLQENGYKTGAFGKVHFRPHFESLFHDYKQYGFDVSHITEDCRSGEWLDWVMENAGEHVDDILATLWNLPEFEYYGKDKINLKERIEKIKENYQWNSDEFPEGIPMAYAHKYPKEFCQTEWITKKALEFLYDESVTEPIFAHVSYVQPHSPFNVPAEYLQYVDESKIPEALPAEWYQNSDAPKYFEQFEPNTEYKTHRKIYFADMVHLDEQLGKIMQALKDTNRYDDTMIVFLSDHGEMLGDHGFFSKEERHYEACVRVPIAISVPGGLKCNIHSGFIQHEDICPTILDYAGLALPPLNCIVDKPGIPLEKTHDTYGKSLLGICKGEDPHEREYAYVESYNHIRSLSYTDWARTVVTHKYRYTYYANFTGEQLFDLEHDPDEQVNLANKKDYKEIKQYLRDILMELIIRQDYPKSPRDLFSLGVH